MAYFVAAFIFLIGCFVSVFVAFAQGMATAPRYDNTPAWVFWSFTTVAVLVAVSHNRLPVW